MHNIWESYNEKINLNCYAVRKFLLVRKLSLCDTQYFMYSSGNIKSSGVFGMLLLSEFPIIEKGELCSWGVSSSVLLRCWNVCFWSRETGNNSATRQFLATRIRSTKSRQGGFANSGCRLVCEFEKPNVLSFSSSLLAMVKFGVAKGESPFFEAL